MALMKFREQNQVKWQGSRPGHNGTQVFMDGSANNTVVILYTVPVGKVFYFTAYTFEATPNLVGNAVLSVYDDVPAIWKRIQYIENFVGGNLVLDSLSFVYPVEIPSSYSVRLSSNPVGFWARATIHGWIE